MDSNLVFLQVQRDVSDPKNIDKVIKNITENNEIDKTANLEELIESFQERILSNFDKDKVVASKGAGHYIEYINDKTERYVRKILKNEIKYDIDSRRFENMYSNCYEIELPKDYKITLEGIKIAQRPYNFFGCLLQFEDTETKEVIDIKMIKDMYTSQKIYDLVSAKMPCELKENIILYDKKKYKFLGETSILDIINIHDKNSKNVYQELQADLLDIYIDNKFINQVNIHNFEPFVITENKLFRIEFFEANTNVPFEFDSFYILNLILS